MIIFVYSFFDNNSGISQHATNFATALGKLNLSVMRCNLMEKRDIVVPQDSVHITISGVQEFASVYRRRTGTNIAYIAWESTEYPKHFLDAIKNCDELWVPSKWQKESSLVQFKKEKIYIPVNVVPEGVDSDVFTFSKKRETHGSLRFLIFGRWEDRKSTKEMIQYWLEAFKDNKNVELIVSADNPFPVDQYKTTEERLAAYGLEDERIKIIHFPERAEYIKLLQEGNILLHASRSEGWGLSAIEAMACGTPTVCTNWGGSTEFCRGAILVPPKELVKAYNVYGVKDCPGFWAEPNWDIYKEKLQDIYNNYSDYAQKAKDVSGDIRSEFTWDNAAKKAATLIGADTTPVIKDKKTDVFVVGCWPNSQEKMKLLEETIAQVHSVGLEVVVVTHYPLPTTILEKADYVIFDKKNILSDDWKPVYFRSNHKTIEFAEAKRSYHAVSVLNNIRNAIDFCMPRWKYMFYLEYDICVDIVDFIRKAKSTKKNSSFMAYEGRGVRTDVWSGKTKELDKLFPRIDSWEDYISSKNIGESQSSGYPLEFWLYNSFGEKQKEIGIFNIDVENFFSDISVDAWDDDLFSVSFINGVSTNIAGLSNREYNVIYSTPENRCVYGLKQKPGMWSQPSVKYYQDWTVTISLDGVEKYKESLDLKGKKVLMQMGSRALGDTIAWVPYFEEFSKKHGCKIVASTWWNKIFDYPDIEFIEIGANIPDLYAAYEIGCFDNQPNRNKTDWRLLTLQQVATDILGLEYKPMRPRLKVLKSEKQNKDQKFFCFSEYSTMKPKLWNYPNGWQRVIDEFTKRGYIAVSISKEPTNMRNVIPANDMPIEQTISVLSSADFYIGLGHGPSWLAWALGIPVVMISGFSEPFSEFENPYRIVPPKDGFCTGCFSNTKYDFNRDWEWCPSGKHYECTKAITPGAVIDMVNKVIEDKKEIENGKS